MAPHSKLHRQKKASKYMLVRTNLWRQKFKIACGWQECRAGSSILQLLTGLLPFVICILREACRRFDAEKSANWLLARSLMLGLSFLSFQRLRFFVCSVALGLPCEGTRDAFDVPGNKQKFLNKIARNHYTTTQNKPLIISEGYHDNFRHQNRFKSLGCTWMIDQNRNFSNLDGIENGELSAQCLVVD